MFADCASYCSTLCARAPMCGTFDEKLCLQGCAISPPPICNPASVAARSCDQLKLEARDYQGAANAANGNGTGGYVSGIAWLSYGLCQYTNDCTSGMACLAATNTCGQCVANADCTDNLGTRYACQSGACQMVECLKNSDCGISSQVCDTTHGNCVECVADADCASKITGTVFPKCSPSHTCVGCLSNADCTSPNLALCLGMSFCTSCTANGDCAAFPGTTCQTGVCQ
jgi:hypothetical protein